MSVSVLSAADAAALHHDIVHLAANGTAAIPTMPADTNPSHFLVTASPASRLGWALTVARIASMAAYAMTYSDDIALDAPPTWTDDDASDCTAGHDPDVNDVRARIGSVIYNAVSNGGADFLPAAAAAILNGVRNSLPPYVAPMPDAATWSRWVD